MILIKFHKKRTKYLFTRESPFTICSGLNIGNRLQKNFHLFFPPKLNENFPLCRFTIALINTEQTMSQ